jgi:dipeptidyl aminopeptidase/acylaminoacyl peptidase
MSNQLTWQILNFSRRWLIGLLLFVLAGLVFVPGAAAQETGVTSQPTASSGLIVFQTSSGGPIYAVNADGSNLHYLTTGLDPALSPDGQQVAFTRWETSQDGALGSLWLINVDGSGERVIHENVYNPRTPVWSADGTQIAISMQHGGRPQPERACGDQPPPRGAYDVSTKVEDGKVVEFCYTLPADPHWGLRLVNVASGAFEDQAGDLYSLSPAWDPANTSRLVYDGERGLVNLDLTQQTTVALTGDVNDHSPVFSPDGSQIAVSYRQDDHWEIHVMNADGSGRVRLTKTSYQALVEQALNGEPVHSYNNASPAWSPDGTQIAFLTDRTGQWEIWVMNADGSNQRPLFTANTLAGISLQYNGMDEQMIAWR